MVQIGRLFPLICQLKKQKSLFVRVFIVLLYSLKEICDRFFLVLCNLRDNYGNVFMLPFLPIFTAFFQVPFMVLLLFFSKTKFAEKVDLEKAD